MKTIQEVIILATEYLFTKKVAAPRRNAEDLLAFVLKCKKIDLYLQFDRPLQEEELALFREYIKRCAKQEPFAYIVEEVEFFGVQLCVSPAVLIPRQETEILASKVAECIEAKGINGKQPAAQECVLWDLCCGSGALGLSLKKKFPFLEVVLSDLSKEAVEVARRNALRNQLQVTIYQGDLFSPFHGKKADFILCNPPYVSTDEWEELDASVKHFEPKMALDGGVDGLAFYRRLKEGVSFLNPRGVLYLEIGHQQGDSVSQIFSSEVHVKKKLEKDWSGRDRFFYLETE